MQVLCQKKHGWTLQSNRKLVWQILVPRKDRTDYLQVKKLIDGKWQNPTLYVSYRVVHYNWTTADLSWRVFQVRRWNACGEDRILQPCRLQYKILVYTYKTLCKRADPPQLEELVLACHPTKPTGSESEALLRVPQTCGVTQVNRCFSNATAAVRKNHLAYGRKCKTLSGL